jgi:hypothetical protein
MCHCYNSHVAEVIIAVIFAFCRRSCKSRLVACWLQDNIDNVADFISFPVVLQISVEFINTKFEGMFLQGITYEERRELTLFDFKSDTDSKVYDDYCRQNDLKVNVARKGRGVSGRGNFNCEN